MRLNNIQSIYDKLLSSKDFSWFLGGIMILGFSLVLGVLPCYYQTQAVEQQHTLLRKQLTELEHFANSAGDYKQEKEEQEERLAEVKGKLVEPKALENWIKACYQKAQEQGVVLSRVHLNEQKPNPDSNSKNKIKQSNNVKLESYTLGISGKGEYLKLIKFMQGMEEQGTVSLKNWSLEAGAKPGEVNFQGILWLYGLKA